MRQFDFYEFTGILVPGVTALAGAVVFLSGWGLFGLIKDTSVRGLGVFIVLAYVAGHVVQAVGNAVETVWWKCRGGIPSDWIRSRPSRLLGPQQSSALQGRIRERLGLAEFDMATGSAHEWYGITRQIYADVAAAGRAARVDTFNGNYGLNRGIAAGSLVVLVLSLTDATFDPRAVAVIVATAAMAFYRMDRFARHYARELFVQFLQLPEREIHKEKNK